MRHFYWSYLTSIKLSYSLGKTLIPIIRSTQPCVGNASAS